MIKLLLRIIKKVAKKPVKAIKSTIKSFKPKKFVRKFNIVRNAKNQIKKYKKLGVKIVKYTSPKHRTIEKITNKANIIENLVESENLMLRKKSNASRDISESTKDILEFSRKLNTYKHSELKEIDKAINEELKGLGIESQEQLSKVIDDEEFREDLVKTNAYQSFMENWKEGFFDIDSETVDENLIEDEKEIIWSQIEESYTFDKYSTEKL